MKVLKKIFTLMLCAFVLAGCVQSEKNSAEEEKLIPEAPQNTESKNLSKLTIVFAPYENLEDIKAVKDSFAFAVRQKMAEKGYNIGAVEIKTGKSFSDAGQILADGNADIGFISGGTYVYFEKDCSILLTAEKRKLDIDSKKAEDWNSGSIEKITEETSNYHRGLIMAGPSEKGKDIAQKLKNGEKISWEELSAAKWAAIEEPSDAGYVYPSMWLYENYGKTMDDLENITFVNSYYEALNLAAIGQADIITVNSYTRQKYADKWSGMNIFGTTGSVEGDTCVIGVTGKIYNDTVCVSKNSSVMTDELKKAFGEAMMEIAQDENGKEIIASFDHAGYAWAQSEDYDDARTARDLLNSVR